MTEMITLMLKEYANSFGIRGKIKFELLKEEYTNKGKMKIKELEEKYFGE